jgi:hypothetical protein
LRLLIPEWVDEHPLGGLITRYLAVMLAHGVQPADLFKRRSPISRRRGTHRECATKPASSPEEDFVPEQLPPEELVKRKAAIFKRWLSATKGRSSCVHGGRPPLAQYDGYAHPQGHTNDWENHVRRWEDEKGWWEETP